MKSYSLPIQFQFNGTVEVQASSLEEAQHIIERKLHATSSLQNDQDNEPFDHRSITDYNLDMKGDLVFPTITMDSLDIPQPTKLTKQDALDAIERIKKSAGDPENAHSMEDILRDDFIFCCTEGLYDSLEEVIEVANIVNQSSAIDFPRWYA